jgi:hypothetical protein
MMWDKGECTKLFSRHNVRLRNEDIKFCRRVGPKGERPRPLIIGFYSHATRNAVLRINLKDAAPHLTLGPDLTKKQREEEAEIWKEMEERNNKRTEDEKAKNLHWRVVGQKGERRLIRGTDRGTDTGARPGTGANATPQGASVRRGVQRGRPPGTTRGATRGGTGRGRPSMQQTSLLAPLGDDQPFRPRLSSKRNREEARGEDEEDEEMQEPPSKQ